MNNNETFQCFVCSSEDIVVVKEKRIRHSIANQIGELSKPDVLSEDVEILCMECQTELSEEYDLIEDRSSGEEKLVRR